MINEKGMGRYLEMVAKARARGLIPADIRGFHRPKTGTPKRYTETAQASESPAAKINLDQVKKDKIVKDLKSGCRLDDIPSVGNGL